MNLTQVEIELFYKLWYAMVWGINEKHKVIRCFEKPQYGTRVSVSIEEFMKVRNAMWDNPEWIDEFLAENNSDEFTEQERTIIKNWRNHFVKGNFIVVKHLSKYTVVMSFSGKPLYLYGVHGISDPLKNTLPYAVPFPVDLVLLPWGDGIIYDSLAAKSNLSFGATLRTSVKEWYDSSKEQYGIIESLGVGNPVVNLPRSKNSTSSVNLNITTENTPIPAKMPKVMTEKYNEIADMIKRFSKENLDEEYQDICLKALAKLCRKRPSPLLKGRVSTWACGIVYAIGSNNFIFDKSQDINMTATEIAQWFGLSKSTAGNKASEISNILKISQMDAEYALKRFVDLNPAVWMFDMGGFIIDIRTAPYEIQKEVYDRGLIPYIPGDRE